MQWLMKTIDCNKHYNDTKRVEPFNVIVVIFRYASCSEDKVFLDAIIEKGLGLANKVKAGAANDALSERSRKRIEENCIAGLLAEQLWKEYLNREDLVVKETDFDGADKQIDLAILCNNKKIEVRSSFPRNGIEFAICHGAYQFDIIGPYTNNYKPAEIQKDYYIRTLFHIEKGTTFSKKLTQNDFEASLTGGATWSMMVDDKIALTKSFIPEDEIQVKRLESASSYRVVPFSRALDTKQIYDLVRHEV